MSELKFQDITEEGLKQLAIDMYNGKVFTDKNCPDDWGIVKMIFLPIAFGAFEGVTEDEINSIGMIYEYLDKMEGIMIDGKPIFYSMYILSIDQVEILGKYFKEYEKSFLISEN